MEVDQADGAVEILHESGAILDPVTAIQIANPVHVADLRLVDVAADDAIDAIAAGESGHGDLEIGDIADSGFGLGLEEGGDRPVPEAKAAEGSVHVTIQMEDQFVSAGADPFQESIAMDEAVELMSVEHEVALAIGCGVDDAFGEAETAEAQAFVILEKFVVIAVEIRDASGLAIAAEEFLDEHIAVIRPEPRVAQLPAIDDIPDEVEMIAFVLAEEIQDRVHL